MGQVARLICTFLAIQITSGVSVPNAWLFLTRWFRRGAAFLKVPGMKDDRVVITWQTRPLDNAAITQRAAPLM